MALFRRPPALYQADEAAFVVPVSTAARSRLAWPLLAAATGLAFASWIDKGAGIFMAMVESGLAWCF